MGAKFMKKVKAIDLKDKANNWLLYIDVSPLWELDYTGISNVVYELARRYVENPPPCFEIRFTVFRKVIEVPVIQHCLLARSGQYLQEKFKLQEGINDVEMDEHGVVDGHPTLGLFLHRKPPQKVYLKDSYLFYDFSFILTQECHTADTVEYHLDGLRQQIETTDLFFTISESTAKDLLWLYDVPEENCHVTLLGHNVDRSFAEEARKKISNNPVDPFFLLLGTIEPRKNMIIVLKWLQQNLKIMDKYCFIFAGRQGWGKPFSEYVEEFGLSQYMDEGRIVHLGYVSEAEKATLLVATQALVFPSLFEGFGLPVLEAMAIGTPVIASCSTSIPEVLGQCGYYFDPYCVESFDKAIAQFFHGDMTGRNIELISRAKSRANSFSYDRTYNLINSILQQEICSFQE